MKFKTKNGGKRLGKSNKLTKILAKLILAAVGVVLIVSPGSTLTIIVRVLGGALMLIGLIGVISFVASPYKGVLATFLFVLSSIAILLSLVPLINPGFVISFFPFVIGIGLAVKGIADMVEAFSLKRTLGVWFVPLLLSLLTVAAGCVIAFYPFGTMELLVKIVGAVCVYNAIVGLFMAIMYKPPVEINGVIDITEDN